MSVREILRCAQHDRPRRQPGVSGACHAERSEESAVQWLPSLRGCVAQHVILREAKNLCCSGACPVQTGLGEQRQFLLSVAGPGKGHPEWRLWWLASFGDRRSEER